MGFRPCDRGKILDREVGGVDCLSVVSMPSSKRWALGFVSQLKELSYRERGCVSLPWADAGNGMRLVAPKA